MTSFLTINNFGKRSTTTTTGSTDDMDGKDQRDESSIHSLVEQDEELLLVAGVRRTPRRPRLGRSGGLAQASFAQSRSTLKEKFQSLLTKRDNPLFAARSRNKTTSVDNEMDEEQATNALVFLSLDSAGNDEDEDEDDEEEDDDDDKDEIHDIAPFNVKTTTTSPHATYGQQYLVDDVFKSFSLEDLEHRQSYSIDDSDRFVNVSQQVSAHNISVNFDETPQLDFVLQQQLDEFQHKQQNQGINPTAWPEQNQGEWSAEFDDEIFNETSSKPTETTDITSPIDQTDDSRCHRRFPTDTDDESHRTVTDSIVDPPLTCPDEGCQQPHAESPANDIKGFTSVSQQASMNMINAPNSEIVHLNTSNPDIKFPPSGGTRSPKDVDPPSYRNAFISPTMAILSVQNTRLNDTDFPFTTTRMTPQTPVEINNDFLPTDLLQGPPRLRTSFANVSSISPTTPQAYDNPNTCSHTGTIFGPVQLPTLQSFQDNIIRLDLMEEELDEMTATGNEKTRNVSADRSPNMTARLAVQLPTMPAL